MLDNLITDVIGANEIDRFGRLESVSVRLVAAREDGADLLLQLAAEVEGVPVPASRWTVKCCGVRGAQLSFPDSGLPGLHISHPLLLPFVDSTAELYVHSAAFDPRDLTADLFHAHNGAVGEYYAPWTWLRQESRAFAMSLHNGSALLASGPRSVLEAYKKVADKHTMRPALRETTPATADRLQLFAVGSSWVVAERFEPEQLAG